MDALGAQVAYQVTKEAHEDGLLDPSEFSATMDELKATFRTNINSATGGRLKDEQIKQLEHEALFPPVRLCVCMCTHPLAPLWWTAVVVAARRSAWACE